MMTFTVTALLGAWALMMLFSIRKEQEDRKMMTSCLLMEREWSAELPNHPDQHFPSKMRSIAGLTGGFGKVNMGTDLQLTSNEGTTHPSDTYTKTLRDWTKEDEAEWLRTREQTSPEAYERYFDSLERDRAGEPAPSDDLPEEHVLAITQEMLDEADGLRIEINLGDTGDMSDDDVSELVGHITRDALIDRRMRGFKGLGVGLIAAMMLSSCGALKPHDWGTNGCARHHSRPYGR